MTVPTRARREPQEVGGCQRSIPGTRSYAHSPYAQYSYYLDGYGFEAEGDPEPRSSGAGRPRRKVERGARARGER
jgi:hypothetical protein